MKAFFALVWHEVLERKALLAAAAVASLLPLLAPLLPGTGSNSAADIREAVMWVMVLTLVPLFALLLGVSFIGRDLSEGRLGFYYAQPLSGPTIWFGKLAAVVLLIWTAQLTIMLPTALLSGEPARFVVPEGMLFESLAAWASTVAMWLASVAVILVSHALGVVWRARSMWIVVDLIAIALFVVAARWVISPFIQIFSAYVVMAIYAWLLVSALIGLVMAGAIQLTAGRVDARRGHRALSKTLWSALAVGVAIAGVWGWWVRSASPSDLTRVNEISVGSGEWIAVTGPSTGRFDYFPGFIVNTTDGRWISAHSGSNIHERGLLFSSDQSLAVWPNVVNFEEMRLMAVKLNSQRLDPKWTEVVLKRNWMDMVLSPTGDRVALIRGSMIEVHDLETGDLVVAAQVPDGIEPYRLVFVDENVVSILSVQRVPRSDDPAKRRTRWIKTRLDLTTRALDDGETINNPWQWTGMRLFRPVPNNLERQPIDGEDRLLLMDSNHGEVVADLGEMPGRWIDIREVRHGEIVIKRKTDERCFLDVFDAEGVSLKTIDVDDGRWVDIGGEYLPGLLAVGETVWSDDSFEPNRRATTLVNITSGETTEGPVDVSPVLSQRGWTTSPGAWKVGSVATRLMWGKDYSLHLWNPETNELKQIIPMQD